MSKFLESMRPLVLSRVSKMSLPESLDIEAPDFCQIFESKTVSVIAEIKYKSPKGQIYTGNMTPIEIAKSYSTSGAKAISILTEPHYFDGDAMRIKDVRQALPHMPVLMKDFVLSVKQVQQAKFFGASALLLIVGFLSKSELYDLYHCCLSLKLTPLIEVCSLSELEIALELTPRVIGINHRDLETMSIDGSRTEKLIPHIPHHIHVVAESGIASSSTIQHLHRLGCGGFLVGSHLMHHHNPGVALHQLIHGDAHEN